VVLEDAVGSLDAALSLSAPGANPTDAQDIERPTNLGEAAFAGELLGERRCTVGILDEDSCRSV
jgi:hypothetical protein